MDTTVAADATVAPDPELRRLVDWVATASERALLAGVLPDDPNDLAELHFAGLTAREAVWVLALRSPYATPRHLLDLVDELLATQ